MLCGRRSAYLHSLSSGGPIRAGFVYQEEPPRATHQSSSQILRTRDGRWFVGKKRSAKIRPFLEAFTAIARAHRPPEPLSGPVCLSVHWVFRMAQRRRKCKTHKGMIEVPCTVRPDLDNLAKSVIDCLAAAGWFTNDSVITRLVLAKSEGDVPRLEVEAQDDA